MASAAKDPKPVKFTFYSWNSQGNPVKFRDEKKCLVITYFGETVSPPVIVFLQEGGIGYDGKKEGFPYTGSGAGVGAYNERCTMYVLAKLPDGLEAPSHVQLLDDHGNATIGGGEAGREPAAVRIGRYLFISWHSTASDDNSDTSAMLKVLQQSKRYNDFSLVVIGGDFNSAPDALTKLVQQRENQGAFTASVVACGKPTHKGKRQGEYDYFVVLSRSGHLDLNADLVPTLASDHNAVSVQLTLDI